MSAKTRVTEVEIDLSDFTDAEIKAEFESRDLEFDCDCEECEECPDVPDYAADIRDQPGNESWFTAAPRSKPATTKQDTIDARGMVRS